MTEDYLEFTEREPALFERIKQGDFPKLKSNLMPQDVGMNKEQVKNIVLAALITRLTDDKTRALIPKKMTSYTIGSSGHENMAAFAAAFNSDKTIAFLHYRDAGYFSYMGLTHPNCDPIQDLMYSYTCSTHDPISGGRHKVLGHPNLNIIPGTSTIASQLPRALGTALSIPWAKSLGIEAKFPDDAIVLCGFGDASVNHSTAQGSFNAARWIHEGNGIPLPLIYVCGDNQIGISVPTPKNWVQKTMKERGFHYLNADGLHFPDVYQHAQQAKSFAQKKQPVFFHFECIRLYGHAGPDYEPQYRDPESIETDQRDNDPLFHTLNIAIQSGFFTHQDIIELYKEVKEKINQCTKRAITTKKLANIKEITSPIVPSIKKSIKKPLNKNSKLEIPDKPLTLAQSLNLVFDEIMETYPEVVFFGEDVGKKGGNYGVTINLQKKHSRKHIFDTLLDEQTILGLANGMALNNILPVPEISFIAYLHNAIDQLRGEAATLSFFSNGQYTNPMIIRIPSLGYQRGFGGHYHNENTFATIRDIPGVIICCPSNALDAPKLFRKCVKLALEEQRIVVFLEPIALYHSKEWLFPYPKKGEINEDEIGIYGNGKDLVIITYGNGFFHSIQAANILKEKYNVNISVIDLRWLKPLPEKTLLKAIEPFSQILIIDECRKTASLSEELMTLLLEKTHGKTLKRHCAEDSFIPLGPAWQHLLPSTESITHQCCDVLQIKSKKGATITV